MVARTASCFGNVVWTMALWLVAAFLAGLVATHGLLDGTLDSDGTPGSMGDGRAPFGSGERYRVDDGRHASQIRDRVDSFGPRGLRAR